MKKGKFFAFEGIDGSGKSTQVTKLARSLQELGQTTYTTCEPSTGPIGNMIRQILTGRIDSSFQVVAQLLAADRLDHLSNPVDGILGKLEQGHTVITDRYYFSSFAYNSFDMPLEDVVAINKTAMETLRPTATIYIDLPPTLAMERIAKNRQGTEKFETAQRLTQAYKNYNKAFEMFKEEETVIRINGDNSEEEIAKEILEKVKSFLG